MPTPQAKAIYNTAQWKRVRLEALERDGYRCCACGAPTRVVHHQPPIEILLKQGADVFDLGYLFSLCEACHGHEDGGRAHSPKPKKANRFKSWLDGGGLKSAATLYSE